MRQFQQAQLIQPRQKKLRIALRLQFPDGKLADQRPTCSGGVPACSARSTQQPAAFSENVSPSRAFSKNPDALICKRGTKRAPINRVGKGAQFVVVAVVVIAIV